jgi:hypothetical protein
MNDFDPEVYRGLEQQRQIQHYAGQYEGAAGLAEQMYDYAPRDSVEQGAAARNACAAYDRLGGSQGIWWGEQAYRIHAKLFAADPSDELRRERAISAVYVGVSNVQAIRYGREAGLPEYRELVEEALGRFRTAAADFAELRRSRGYLDQFEINGTRRISIGESFVGSRLAGLRAGIQAYKIAKHSEQWANPTSSPSLVWYEREAAVKRARRGALGAIGIAGLVMVSPRRRNRLLLKAVDKAL